MFERRVVVLLLMVGAGCLLLGGRAAYVQVVEHRYWNDFLESELNRSTLVETTRGRVLDRNGEVLAEDEPCIDARVEFAALLPEPPERWINAKTRQRALDDPTFTRGDKAHWARIEAEVRADHAATWQRLADIAGLPVEEVQARREAIVANVLGRREHLTRRRYEAALAKWEADGRPSWWRRWLLGESGEKPTLADSDEAINEERQYHILLRDVPQAQQNRLEKLEADMPGVALMPGMRRVYPEGPITAHVVGRLGQVSAEDVAADPEAEDRLRRYLPNDLTGRQGIEKLAERRLRGTRGLDLLTANADGSQAVSRDDPVDGEDVRVSLDVRLQRRIAAAFQDVEAPHVIAWRENGTTANVQRKPMNGAAVVMAVDTGDVLALVSAPSFDPNRFEEAYDDLVNDAINTPLLNRGTQVSREIGSTMKVITGVGAMSDGLLEPEERIACDGYLYHNGRRLKFGRCWTMSIHGVAGHVQGRDPHPTSELNLPEGLQRSCNVFFETLGDRMGLGGLDRWQSLFGFGEPTGLGITEVAGRTSGDFTSRNPGDGASEAWLNAMGQGQVQATPIQNAAAMAAVARGGSWVRPRLLPDAPREAGDVRELPVTGEAVALTQRGMHLVSNTDAGTGRTVIKRLEADGIYADVAGKTGSATSSLLRYVDDDGTRRYVPFAPTVFRSDDEATVAAKLAAAEYVPAPWYHPQLDRDREQPVRDARNRMKPQSHAWYVGYAPADEPKVAFAVLVDYGGSGGRSAGSVAREIIAACVELGYLENRPPAEVAEAGD